MESLEKGRDLPFMGILFKKSMDLGIAIQQTGKSRR
jgi:hypothetical protein